MIIGTKKVEKLLQVCFLHLLNLKLRCGWIFSSFREYVIGHECKVAVLKGIYQVMICLVDQEVDFCIS
jgi:hypothetical protein